MQSVLIAPKCLHAVTQGVGGAFGRRPGRRLLPQQRGNLRGAVDHHRLWAGMADHSEGVGNCALIRSLVRID